MSSAPHPDATLRFGVLSRSDRLAAWQAEVVDRLLALDGVELVCVVVDARPAPSRRPRDRIDRIVRSPNAVWNAYNNGWVGRRASSLRPKDVSDRLGAVAHLPCAVEKRGVSEYFPADVIEEIRHLELDFLLRFGFGIIRGDILHSARYGVWSFHHDDEEVYRGSPPAFWELEDDAPVSGAVLQRLTERLDGGQILEKGWFPTVRHSYVRNTDTVHFGGADWPAKVAARILAGDVAAADPPVSSSSAPIYKKPDNATTTRFLARQGARFIGAQLDGVRFADQWEIGVVRAPIHRFVDPDFVPAVEWLGLGDPPHHYAADPFALSLDGAPAVLYERYEPSTRRGEIWISPLDDPAAARSAGLPIDAHASYPFCFEVGELQYCLPQVKGSPPRLYRRVDGGWIGEAPLIDHPVLDPTVVPHQGHWYLLATEPGRHSLTKLLVWHAEVLGGPWRPHPLNPVLTDARCARPAGTPFVHEGALFRPAQDCTGGYGSGVAIAELTVLTPSEFRQEVRAVHRPRSSWPFDRGMHTLSSCGELTLLDARRRVFSRHETAAELRGRLRKARGSSA